MQELAERIIDLVFEDPEMLKLQRRAIEEMTMTGEVSEITKKYAEQRIKELVEGWKQ